MNSLFFGLWLTLILFFMWYGQSNKRWFRSRRLSIFKKWRKRLKKLLLKNKSNWLRRPTKVLPMSKGNRLWGKARKKRLPSTRVLPMPIKQSLPRMPPNPRKIGKKRLGSRRRFLLPFDSALAWVVRLPWSLFLWLRLRIQGWWFILTRCSRIWFHTRKTLPFPVVVVPLFWTTDRKSVV